MDPLARLFGTPARLKLLRLFLFNDDTAFSVPEALFRAKAAKDVGKKEIALLLACGILRKKLAKQGTTYAADKRFAHYDELKTFLRTTTDVSDTYLLSALKKAGSLKLVTLTGLFTGVIESKIDLLVVGDKLEEKPLASAVHALEAELGRELRYASFSTEEFRYRLGVYDRLLRDVFDYPNRTVIDKLGVTAK
ncbi:hypothetical protein KJ819_00905 [Patescibacteria group bacterium]|nr:hypothetical protein [Patescibacteria group bacterium]MBU1500712.1 hypothetical protein [Patescibacteria group bacterium]MBU2080416.1 hypothetical protein [Patescibacteria group bacterium]MBU2194377.1 hypothetical protein [Patescibacteria group bacterium]MBU2330054.1 hypothetical protein [Patescibacteria group bacterium]